MRNIGNKRALDSNIVAVKWNEGKVASFLKIYGKEVQKFLLRGFSVYATDLIPSAHTERSAFEQFTIKLT